METTTGAVTWYDGIFKGLYEESLRPLFHEARKHFSNGDINAGKESFKQALSLAKGFPRDKNILETLLREISRYESCKIANSVQPVTDVDWAMVGTRALQRLDESFYCLPQGVFFLDIGRPGEKGYVRLVGRKILSDLWLAGKIPEIFCSFVTADMILGLYVNQRLSDSNISIHYNPITSAEKLRVMSDIMKKDGLNAELTFPFPLMRESTRREWGSPPEGWVVDNAFDVMLSCGEERIRAYSIQFLQENAIAKPILYDPACSTGVFLSTLQQGIPGSYTFAQDLSQQMTDIARERVNEAHCANALYPAIKPGGADVCYIRFLNSEVIKTEEAETILSALLPTVKDGGYIVTFGHTPVLLSSANFRCLNEFHFKQSVGVSVDKTGIFQYYVIQKTATS